MVCVRVNTLLYLSVLKRTSVARPGRLKTAVIATQALYLGIQLQQCATKGKTLPFAHYIMAQKTF